MPPIPFAIATEASRSLPLNAQRLVNFFHEKQPQSSKSQVPLFGVPGLVQFTTVGSGPIRGLWQAQSILYAVSGSEFYSIDLAGNATKIGGGLGGTAPYSMSDNGVQVVMTNAVGGGFCYTIATNTFQQIKDDAFYPANTVQFFDGYFVFDRAGTNEFFLSALYDGLTYNGLDFASAEASPGKVLATVQNLQLQFIFCTSHVELWYDAGTADFPFARYPGGVINRGIAGSYCVVKEDDAIFFLGADKIFYRLQGNTPIRVSTHSMETVIASSGNLTDSYCFSYTIEGHKLVHLTIPDIKRTLIYDISTQEWHERESWDEKKRSLGRWRGNCTVGNNGQSYGGVTYCGDAFSNKLGRIDWSVNTEYGNTIRALAYSVPIHYDRKRIFFSKFELDVESGTGDSTGDGVNPEISMRVSKNGARTFGIINPKRSIGRQGQYLARQRWLRMGSGRQWVFEISITSPTKRNIIAAHGDYKIGSN